MIITNRTLDVGVAKVPDGAVADSAVRDSLANGVQSALRVQAGLAAIAMNASLGDLALVVTRTRRLVKVNFPANPGGVQERAGRALADQSSHWQGVLHATLAIRWAGVLQQARVLTLGVDARVFRWALAVCSALFGRSS